MGLIVGPARQRPPLFTGPTSVYRLFDDAGHLLYVGVAAEPFLRLDQHWKSQPWWHQVRTVRIEWYATRADAMVEELWSIRREDPAYNVQGRGGHAERRPTPELRPAQMRDPEELTWIGGE